MRNLDDLVKGIIILIVGIIIMSTLSTIPGGESYASLGRFLIIMAFIIMIISFLMPFLKKFL